MEIFVKTPTGQSIALEVKATDTIDDMKFNIQDNEGTPIGEQRLMFEGNQLEGGYTLPYYNIQSGSIISLIVSDSDGSMRIFVKRINDERFLINTERKIQPSNEPSLPLRVQPSDTIEILKEKIKSRINIPTDEQRLVFNDVVLEDLGQTLTQYSIEKESTVCVIHNDRMRIIVSGHVYVVAFEIYRYDTIATVKQKVKEKMGVPIDLQLLSLEGFELADRRMLADYDYVEEECIIRLHMKPLYKKVKLEN